MSRSHSRNGKRKAANARRAAHRPRWSVWDTPLGWLVIGLAFVPVLVFDVVSRMAERIRR